MKKIINLMAVFAATAMCAVPMASSAASKTGLLKLDVNSDGVIDSVDASMVLKEYATLSCDNPATFTNTQKYVADANNDGKIDSIDSSRILKVYTANSSGNEVPAIRISFSPVIKREKSFKAYPDKNDYDEAFNFLEAEKGKDYYVAYLQIVEISDDITIPVTLRTVYRDERIKY